jgi:hypothetical protein
MSEPPRTGAILDVLKSIDQSLRTLVVIAQKKAEARVTQAATKPGTAAGTAALAGAIASDRDLDGEHGDPEIKAKDPRDWTGEPMQGRKFSECPAEYLELVAERLDYFAEQAEATNELASNGKPKALYNRRDAARARGWAKRVREGTHVPKKQEAPVEDDWAALKDDDVPF